jgi:hypothetical protein
MVNKFTFRIPTIEGDGDGDGREERPSIYHANEERAVK